LGKVRGRWLYLNAGQAPEVDWLPADEVPSAAERIRRWQRLSGGDGLVPGSCRSSPTQEACQHLFVTAAGGIVLCWLPKGHREDNPFLCELLASSYADRYYIKAIVGNGPAPPVGAKEYLDSRGVSLQQLLLAAVGRALGSTPLELSIAKSNLTVVGRHRGEYSRVLSDGRSVWEHVDVLVSVTERVVEPESAQNSWARHLSFITETELIAVSVSYQAVTSRMPVKLSLVGPGGELLDEKATE
jgi:hypothetical protein